MLTLHLESSIHDSTPVILVRFPYDAELLRKVKTIRNARWSHSLRAWMIPQNDSALLKIRKAFGDSVKFDTSLLKEIAPEKENRNALSGASLSAEKQKSIERFVLYLRARRYSERTIHTYTDALRTFLKFCGRKELNEISNDDLLSFNTDHILAKGLSSSYQNHVINSVKLFFREIQRTKMDVNIIFRPRREHRLPNVLGKEEIKRILESPVNLKHRSMLSLIYSCGLRRSELLNLKPMHIDSGRKILNIKQSKGKKDRIVPLSEKIILMLREYYKAYRPKEWLFEGQQGGQYSETSLEAVLKQAVHKCGIKKPVSLHWLRHSYATHLLENGTDLRYIQELLGHSSSRTTEIYTHVSTKNIQQIRSPFDDL